MHYKMKFVYREKDLTTFRKKRNNKKDKMKQQ